MGLGTAQHSSEIFHNGEVINFDIDISSLVSV